MKSDKKSDKDKKTVVVTTSFLQDMTEQITGDTVNIELIIPAGEDPHLYTAKPEDNKKLQALSPAEPETHGADTRRLHSGIGLV